MNPMQTGWHWYIKSTWATHEIFLTNLIVKKKIKKSKTKKRKIKYLTLKQGNFLGSKCYIRQNITCFYYYMLAPSKVALSSRRPEYTVNFQQHFCQPVKGSFVYI